MGSKGASPPFAGAGRARPGPNRPSRLRRRRHSPPTGRHLPLHPPGVARRTSHRSPARRESHRGGHRPSQRGQGRTALPAFRPLWRLCPAALARQGVPGLEVWPAVPRAPPSWLHASRKPVFLARTARRAKAHGFRCAPRQRPYHPGLARPAVTRGRRHHRLPDPPPQTNGAATALALGAARHLPPSAARHRLSSTCWTPAPTCCCAPTASCHSTTAPP